MQLAGIKRFVEKHFGVVLMLSCAFGLICPPLARLPNVTVVIALAMLMFISCYKLHENGFGALRWRQIMLFYALRYGALPPVLWFITHLVAPDYAIGVFLLTMLPAAVSSPAFAAIFGGTMAPAFAIVIVSQLLTPFLIPLQFAMIGGVAATPAPGALFMTMVWCIFTPLVVYAFVHKHQSTARHIRANNKLWSVLLVALVIALAIAKQRDVILSGHGIAISFILALACFALYIAFGYYLFRKAPREERITYAASSGFNNAALGVSLALLHFSGPVVLFVAVSEMGWSLLPVMLGIFLRRVAR